MSSFASNLPELKVLWLIVWIVMMMMIVMTMMMMVMPEFHSWSLEKSSSYLNENRENKC